MLQKKSLLLIVLIAAGATSLSIASYQYHDSTSNRITSLAKRDIHDNAIIEANAISRALSTKIADVAGNLRLLANAPSVQNGDVTGQQLFDSSQTITSDLTDGYYWIDRDGKIVTYSEINTGKFPDYRGDDLSFREYYKVPKQTLKPFISTVIDSRDGVLRLYLSHPIVDLKGNFSGVVVAAISTKNAGDFVQSQLLPQYRSTVGLMDRDGLILYSNNQTLIGIHYDDAMFQSVVPDPIKAQFNSFLERSKVNTSEVEDISYGPNTVTIASKAVLINGEHSWTAYIVYPHVLTDETASLLNQQSTFNIVIIVAIGIAAILTTAMVLTWNKRLEMVVEKKTVELKHAADSLARVNEQLRERDKMQTEFINIAAHELRTPIQPVLGVIELLKQSAAGKAKTEITDRQLAIMDRNARRLQKLSSEILDATRIEAGTLRMDMEVMDINENIRNAIADTKSWIPDDQKKSLQIRFRPVAIDEFGYPIPLLVKADKLRIFQVISNLLRNAIKFSAEEGGSKGVIITVTTDKRDDDGNNDDNNSDGGGNGGGGYAIVSVKDCGAGISAEVLPRLFTKFSTDREWGGTGLGLFIAKNIVEAHGGRIWAENNNSSGDGKRGATFSFMLPLAAAKP
jgi:signal transduction histidine kinase